MPDTVAQLDIKMTSTAEPVAFVPQQLWLRSLRSVSLSSAVHLDLERRAATLSVYLQRCKQCTSCGCYIKYRDRAGVFSSSVCTGRCKLQAS